MNENKIFNFLIFLYEYILILTINIAYCLCKNILFNLQVVSITFEFIIKSFIILLGGLWHTLKLTPNAVMLVRAII